MAGNSNNIPQALTAKTHTDLMKAMIANNHVRSKEFIYNIMHVEKTWYAWYYTDWTQK